MKYVGLTSQIRKNNIYSGLLLIAFPALLLGMVYIITWFAVRQQNSGDYYAPYPATDPDAVFLRITPVVLAVTGIWFMIAWFSHSTIIRMATGARPLERKENKRVYNLVENLCISQGMKMPSINIIEDDSLNAFASGMNENTYTVTLSSGIIRKLNDDELEGVIAHELTHIRNRDVRLLIISIIFVGIFSFLAELAFRSLRFAGRGRKSRDGKGGTGLIILIAIVVTAVCYLLSVLLRFGISRSREYLADAGSAEMTKKPYALASALRKIDEDPLIEAVQSRDVAQLFIDNPKPSSHTFSWDNLFATHPPIQKRIELLEQFV